MSSKLTILLGRVFLSVVLGFPICCLYGLHHGILIVLGNISPGKHSLYAGHQCCGLLSAAIDVSIGGGIEERYQAQKKAVVTIFLSATAYLYALN